MNMDELSICVSNEGVKFGVLKETDIAAWKNEVKEFTDLEGRVIIVGATHINKDFVDGVDNIYTLKEIMNHVYDRHDSGILGNFSRFEIGIIKEVYNINEVDEELLKRVETRLSELVQFRLERERASKSGEME